MNSRSIALMIFVAFSLALLGPYVGVHLLTSPPQDQSTLEAPREPARRRVVTRPSSAPPSGELNGGASPLPSQRPLSPEKRDLADIENLLNDSEAGSSR